MFYCEKSKNLLQKFFGEAAKIEDFHSLSFHVSLKDEPKFSFTFSELPNAVRITVHFGSYPNSAIVCFEDFIDRIETVEDLADCLHDVIDDAETAMIRWAKNLNWYGMGIQDDEVHKEERATRRRGV